MTVGFLVRLSAALVFPGPPSAARGNQHVSQRAVTPMKIELWPLERIKPYPGNPRQNDDAVDAVARSLQEFGFRQPIVIDEDGVIIAGHTRWKAAKKLGLAKVPVHVAKGLSQEQIKAYRIADNQTATIAEWDKELLPIELGQLKEAGYDLGLLGFDADELERLLGEQPKEGLCDPDEVPEAPKKATTQPGDVWELGEHRLLCGDSTKVEDVSRLMGKEVAKLVFTDPPWNVAIGQDSNPRHRQRDGLANDNLSPADFANFLRSFSTAIHAHLDGDLYCVLGAAEWPSLDATLREVGFHWSATVIWVKDLFVLGRSKYHRRYEPIWYGWRADRKSSYRGGRSQDDVWEIQRPRVSEEHPTMKPVALVAKAIQNSSLKGDIVLDPFLGSGTTILAAEQLGRRCFGVELSPNFCDVIVKRYEQFSGKKGERLS